MGAVRQILRGKEDLSHGAGGGVGVDTAHGLAVNGDVGGAVVGVLGPDQVDLSAVEGHIQTGPGVGPGVGPVQVLVAGLGVPAVGEGEPGILNVDDLHTGGSALGLFKALAGLEHSHLGEHGLCAGGGDGDSQLVGGDGGLPAQALGTDGGALVKGLPGSAVQAVLHGKFLDPLAEGDGLLYGDHIKDLPAPEIQLQRGGGGALVDGPIGVIPAVQHIAGLIAQGVAPDFGGGGGGPLGLVQLEGLGDVLAKLSHPVQNGPVHIALVVGGHVQQQRGVVAHGVEVHIAQVGNALGGALLGAPEPTGGNPGIHLGHGPLVAVLKADEGALGTGTVAVNGVVFPVDLGFGPGLLVGVAVLVADPAHGGVGLRTKQHTVGGEAGLLALVLLDGVEPLLEVILLGIGAAALGAVHPDLFKVAGVAVFGVAQDLLELVVIVLVVILGIVGLVGGLMIFVVVAVALIVDIPGGQVQTHVHVVGRTGRGDLRQDIAAHVVVVVARVAGGLHVVLGVGTVPDTEAVMVLGGDDQFLKSRIFQGRDQLIRVKIGLQRKNIIRSPISVVFAPLDLVKGIGAEVTERRQLLFLVLILVCIRNDCVLGRGIHNGGRELCIGDVARFSGHHPLARHHGRNRHGKRHQQ